jgi:hypothetical protein
MNEETVKAMTDAELGKFIKLLSNPQLSTLVPLAHAEAGERMRKRKEDAVTRIKQIANAEGIVVQIKGVRGRPAKRHSPKKLPKAAQAK